MSDNENIIETIDENGIPIKFQLFDVIEYKGQDYAMLLPVEEEGEDTEPELVLMRLVSEGDEEYSFETIDDEDEFNEVAEYIATVEEDIDDED